MSTEPGDGDPPFAVTVSGTPPTRRQVVAPERSIGSGRYGALRDHDDKHRDDHPDQSTQHAGHALPKTKPWYATGAALVTAGALVLVALSAVAVAALNGGGGKDGETADATPVTSVQQPTPTAAPTSAAPTAEPTPSPAPSSEPTAPPTVEPASGEVTLTGTLKVSFGAGDFSDSCWYVDTPDGTWAIYGGSGEVEWYTEQDINGDLVTRTSGIYRSGTAPDADGGGTPLYGIGRSLTVTGTPSVQTYRGLDGTCKPAPAGAVYVTSFG